MKPEQWEFMYYEAKTELDRVRRELELMTKRWSKAARQARKLREEVNFLNYQYRP